jgi:hypothetical protein
MSTGILISDILRSDKIDIVYYSTSDSRSIITDKKDLSDNFIFTIVFKINEKKKKLP